jgi:hypothetical protein
MTKDERQSGGSRFLGDLEPQKQEWVGLTEEEIGWLTAKFIESIEAKLRGKNGG